MYGGLLHCGISPSSIPHHLSLPAGDGILAVCVAGRGQQLYVPGMGHSLRNQQWPVTRLRHAALHHSNRHHQFAPG